MADDTLPSSEPADNYGAWLTKTYKITRESVLAIFWMAHAGIKHGTIAHMFGISERHVSDIFGGAKYGWLTGKSYADYRKKRDINKAKTLRERIEAMSIPEPNTGCWLWLSAAARDKNGRQRGYIGIRDSQGTVRTRIASRISYEAYHGPAPDDLHVLHKCDTPMCVNPSHLFLGTQQDNMDDMARKGRRKRGITGARLTHPP